MNTSMSKIKEMALIFNAMECKIDNDLFMVDHPFITSVLTPYKDLTFLDIRETGNVDKAKEYYNEIIKEATDYWQLLMSLNKRYVSAFFKYTKNYLSDKDFSTALFELFTTLEYPNNDVNITLNDFVRMFKRVNKKYIISDDEQEVYNNLPDVVTVYRGVKPNAKVKALSWTIDKEVAQWFADRWEKNGKVYKAKINKKDILIYTNARNEKETILDYHKLYDIEEVER